MKRYFNFCLFSIICSTAIANNDFNDWQDYDFCQNQSDRLCNGYYIEPKYPLEITKNHPLDTIIINADKTKLVNQKKSTFDGNVSITKNNQQLKADHVAIQQNTQGKIESFTADGNVRLIEPGMRVLGSRGKVLQKPNYKVIYDAKYRIYTRHARGDASKIEIFEDQTMELPNASYTTCKPGNNNWCLKAKKISLNKTTGRGEAWDAKMYVKDIPIFYTPYINFPIDSRRKTGFLPPIWGHDSKNGTTFGIPFYWNMAENYDYTVSPFYMSKRGYKFDNQFRYLTNNSSGNIRFNFLPNDSSYRNLKHRRYRHALWFSNNLIIDKNWKLFVNYNKVSDNDYLYNFGQDVGQNNQNITNTIYENSLEEVMQNSSLHLEQSAKLENINKYGLFKLRILQYQTLYPSDGLKAEEQYKKMPEVAWDSNYINLPAKYRIKYNINYTDFKLNSIDALNNGALGKRTTGKRINSRPSLEHPFYASYGYLKPRVQLDYLSYKDLHLNNFAKLNHNSTNPSRAIPMFDINSGLNFIKPLSNNWQQTLEPKLYYLYVPKTDQTRYPVFDTTAAEFSYDQLFRDNRYNGPDRLADANQVTLGVKTGLYPENGEEKASFGIARTRYFRGLTSYLGENLEFGRWSPIGMLLDYRVNPQILLEANVVRQKLNQTRSSTLNAQYKLEDQKIINLGYQYVRFTTVPQHQGQSSIVWSIRENLNLLGKFDYDLSQKRPVYTLAGMELHGCCTILRIAVARSLLPKENFSTKQYNTKFLAQIVFKGFTGVGDLESNYISGKIPGYTAKERF